jgi:hypothetical protein
MSRIRIPVEKLDPETDEILAWYPKIMDAAEANYIYGGSISKACRGQLTIVGGFKWQYASVAVEGGL